MQFRAKLLPQSLAGRVFALFAGTLIAFFGIGVGVYYYQEFTTGVDDALDSAHILSEVMMPTIADSVVIGDYDTVRRTLAKAIQRSPFSDISFIDTRGGIVRAERTVPFTDYSPQWLRALVRERLSDVNQVVAVGGRDYGVLRMRFAPEAIAGSIWKLTSSALAVGATMLLVGLLLIRVSLHRWLGGLGRFRDYDWRLDAGAAGREQALRNAPIEIREAFDAFMRTGTELQVQRVTADATLNAVDDGVVTTDAEGRILYVNPAATAMLHGSPGPLLRQDIAAILPTLFGDRKRDGRLESWSGRRIEMPAGAGSPAILDAAFTPIRGGGGDTIGHVLALRDVTAEQAYEEQLRTELAVRAAAMQSLRHALEDMLPPSAIDAFVASDTDLEGVARLVASLVQERESSRQALDNQKFALDQHAAVSVADADGTITYANAKFSELSGYAIDELVGSNHRLTSSGLHPAAFYEEIWDTIASGHVWHGEIANRRRNGMLYWVATTIVPWLDDQGRPRQYVAIRTDISEQKRVEHALGEARRRELATGAAIQRALLFGDRPVDVPAAEIGSYTEPSLGIDGDFYAFTRYRDDCLELLVGDVMGKGVPAALVGAAVRTAYNQVGTELLAESLGSAELPRPAAVMNALHRKLTPRLIELDTFVTMALYRFDFAAGTMTLVNAGHTAALVLRHAGGVDTVLGDNLPMGVLAEELYVESTVDVAAGDALVVFSDGVTEAHNTEGVEFGVTRLQAFLERASRCALPAGTCMQALRKAVRDFVGLRVIPDDQTAVMVALRAPGREATREFDLPWDLAGLEPLRRHVAAAAAPLGEDASDRLVLAAFEAATNVVRHVARPFDDATLSCRIERSADRVTVELWYVGLPFVRDPAAQPDFSGASEGGFGLYIIEQAVSEVRYENPLLDVCCTRLVQRAPEAVAA